MVGSHVPSAEDLPQLLPVGWVKDIQDRVVKLGEKTLETLEILLEELELIDFKDREIEFL